jgi:hypothetical protein
VEKLRHCFPGSHHRSAAFVFFGLICPGGKRSDYDSEDLIASVPEPRRLVRGRQAIGVRLLLRFYFGCGRDGREISLLGLQVGTVTPPHPNSLDQGRFWGIADMDNLDFHVWV